MTKGPENGWNRHTWCVSDDIIMNPITLNGHWKQMVTGNYPTSLPNRSLTSMPRVSEGTLVYTSQASHSSVGLEVYRDLKKIELF